MYIYEKPVVELIDFSLEKIMDDPTAGGKFSGIEEGEGSGDDF